jgi:hypothetical protein
VLVAERLEVRQLQVKAAAGELLRRGCPQCGVQRHVQMLATHSKIASLRGEGIVRGGINRIMSTRRTSGAS